MVDIETLQHISIFNDLAPDAMEKIAETAQILIYEADEDIFYEGDASRDLYVLMEGKFAIETNVPGRVKDNPKAFYTVKPGEIIGEFSFVDGAPRSASARAQRDSKLLKFNGKQLSELLDADPEVGYIVMRNIARVLCSRIRNTNLTLRNALVWL